MKPGDQTTAKLPPQNLEAERSVLGAMLLSGEAINRVVELLTQESFYRDAHRRILSAIISL
jgi:replicative DNA helicase